MRLIILGSGGYGQTVADIASQSGDYEQILFLDDRNPSAYGSCEKYVELIDACTAFYPAFGNNELRLSWLDRLEGANARIATLIHSSAYVSPTATVLSGAVILPHATVNTNVTVGRGVIVNCNAAVDHGCVLEDGVHVCLGAIVKAENQIPTCQKIEAGAVIENRTFPLQDK